MSRRKGNYKREVIPDPIYNDIVISKFVNTVMRSGKKNVAQGIVYDALTELKGKVQGEEPLTVFKKAIENVKPSLEVRSRRVGGATYQVPVEVGARQSTAKAMRWVINAARKRSEKGMISRLAGELNDALQGRGEAVKKREDTHRMAQANKAFAHFRW